MTTSASYRKQPYPHVTAWGRSLGSPACVVEELVAQAVVDGAPEDAIFKDTDGVWHTLGDLQRQAPAPSAEGRLSVLTGPAT
jgi:hypothetical protein